MDVGCGQPRVHKEGWWRNCGSVAGARRLSFRCEQNSGARAGGGAGRRKTFAYKRKIADEGRDGAVWWRGLWVVCECAAAEFPKSSIANFSVCERREFEESESSVDWRTAGRGGAETGCAGVCGGWRGESGRPPPAQTPTGRRAAARTDSEGCKKKSPKVCGEITACSQLLFPLALLGSAFWLALVGGL